MANVVIMPRQGQSVESCILAKWHKEKGDSISAGDILFTYETDKATFDEESKADGVLLAVFCEEGDDVPCLTNVCVIGQPGEDVSAFAPEGAAEPEKASEQPAPAQSASVVSAAPVQAAPSAQDGLLKISPRARNLAKRSGADVSLAAPSGPNSRIIERDIQKAVDDGKLLTRAAQTDYVPGSGATGTGIGGRVTAADISAAVAAPVQTVPALPEFEEIAIKGIRKVIAKSMHASLMESAQLTLNSSFDATDIFEFRRKLKQTAEKSGVSVVSVTDIIVYATSRILPKYKSLNAHFLGDKMRLFSAAHIAIATDTPRGLLVPVVFGADTMPLAAISARAKELFGMCREGSISPDLITGGTFTISNLGTFGIESFTPVLNPPQTGILGVCSVTERTRNGSAYPAMGLSLTFDHRALDGADAARFLKELVEYLENFSCLAALS